MEFAKITVDRFVLYWQVLQGGVVGAEVGGPGGNCLWSRGRVEIDFVDPT